MDKARTDRTLETRERTERPKSWAPPEVLPQPNPRPGFEHRYIRVSVMGQPDPMNASAKLREGWEPVLAEDYPELQIPGNAKGNIEIGGLILCRTPIEFVKQRNDYYLRQAQQQMDSVDNNFMRENDPRMPLFKERKTEVKFGSGK